jgi:hypothetical protein
MIAISKVVERSLCATSIVNEDTNLRHILSHVIIPRCY